MIIRFRVRLQMDGRKAVCILMKYQFFLVQTLESILIKNTNQSYFAYNYFSFVFSQFSLSAVFMKFEASKRLFHRYFESSEIGLLNTQVCGAATNISFYSATSQSF